MSNLTSTIQFQYTPGSEKLVIITHGASEGIDSEFMQKAIAKVKTSNNSVLAIQMPYKDRDESQSSGKELLEELEATERALDFVQFNQFKSLKFIGKSLGGIIFSRYLAKAPADIQEKSSLKVLGFIYGDAVIPERISEMTIIQGQEDKYGLPTQIQETINQSQNKNVKLIVIENADHSYRDSNKQPVYQDKVIEII